MNENLLPWELPGWLGQVRIWIHASLEAADLPGAEQIEQVHLRPWSVVLRVVSNDQAFFFKASSPSFGHETGMTHLLAERYPDRSPELLAWDLERHWMLMRASGIPLRNYVKAEGSPEPWRKVIPLYVQMQKEFSARPEELLALGVFDRRLVKLPGSFADLLEDQDCLALEQSHGLTTRQYGRLSKMKPVFAEMCARLAAFGIPESLHHDDFYDGNIFMQAGRAILTDWGECALAHPFFSLVVMLRSLENTLDLPEGAPQIAVLRDWYLQEWLEFGSMEDLRTVVKLAEQVGYINRALTWRLILAQMPVELRPEYAKTVPAYLIAFLNSMEADEP